MDTGSGTIGTGVSNDNSDIVYMSEVIVRNDITDKMTQRILNLSFQSPLWYLKQGSLTHI